MATRERETERAPEEGEGVVPSLAPWTPPQALENSPASTEASPAPPTASVTELLGLSASPGSVDQLAEVLIQGAAHPRAELVGELLPLLERDAFGGLRASKGHSLRALAVEAVVAKGYPEAMSLRVEDVAHWRGERGDTSTLSPTVVRLTLLVLTFLSAAPLTHSLHPSLFAVLAMLVPLIALVTAFLRPGSKSARTGLGALGVVELFLALATWIGSASRIETLQPVMGIVIVAALLLGGPQDKPE